MGGSAPVEMVTAWRSWKRTGSVTSCVRTIVPAGIVTSAAGGAASWKTTSAVAARAPGSL